MPTATGAVFGQAERSLVQVRQKTSSCVHTCHNSVTTAVDASYSCSPPRKSGSLENSHLGNWPFPC
jgi:hypothetical protein